MTQTVKNRYGQTVTLDNIEKVNMTENGYEITGVQGWGTFYITFDELDGFVPQEGDAFVLMTTNFSYIRGIIIEHRVIRYMTDKQVEESRQRMLDGFRLNKSLGREDRGSYMAVIRSVPFGRSWLRRWFEARM